MRESTSKKPCAVCGEAGDGAHFGAEACRACAAFFRRSVALSKKYTCRNNGQCTIQSSVRCMCRDCRFNKCLAVGMKQGAVQRHRDVLGKRTDTPQMECDSSMPGKSEECLPLVGQGPYTMDHAGMATLQLISNNYAQLENVRKVIHHREGESVFRPSSPRALTYKEANKINVKELNLIADWIINSYAEFGELDSQQKKVLYRHFVLPFMLLESGYQCSMLDSTDVIMMPSGDFIDCNRPETFYTDPEEKEKMSTEDAVRVFGSSFDLYRRNLLIPMQEGRIDRIEFFALCSMVLWDHGLEGQSAECEQIAKRMRSSIIQELVFYYEFVLRRPCYPERLAAVLVLLPALQRSVKRFQEDVEISHVFNVYAVEPSFYELINGRTLPDEVCLNVKKEPLDEDPFFGSSYTMLSLA